METPNMSISSSDPRERGSVDQDVRGPRIVTRWLPMKKAKPLVDELHSHNDAPVGGIVAVAAYDAGRLCGVGFLGRPVARMLDDGMAVEITRVATDRTPNACSALYGALARAAKALGLNPVISYTLAHEAGTCLAAAGFVRVADVPAQASWDRPSRRRVNGSRPTCDKVRWQRETGAPS